MSLNLNLLHEEILEQRQRQRDPLKIGIMVLIALGGILFLYYMFSAYRMLEIKTKLGAVERDWSKVEPQVTAAQKRAAELNDIIKTTKVLHDYVENRFSGDHSCKRWPAASHQTRSLRISMAACSMTTKA